MNYKRKPNNAKATWICPDCIAVNLHDSKAKVKVTNVNNVHASSIVSTPKREIYLNNYNYQLILSPNGWLNDDIFLEELRGCLR